MLQIRGSELFEWEDLTPRQAYWKQAQLLLNGPVSVSNLANRCLSLDSIPEDLQGPMKKLRSELRSVDGLKEQLDSVLPFLSLEGRLETSLAMADAWTHRLSEEEIWEMLPHAARRMYS